MAAKSPYLTAGEVAELYRVHLITVYRLVAAGKLHPLRIGRIWRFDKNEVEAVFKPAAPPPPRADKQPPKPK